MILDEYVEIRLNNKNISYYLDHGYKGEYGDLIVVNTKDLMTNSHVEINIQCDFCGVQKNIMFKDYIRHTKNNTEKYCCKKCSKFKREETISLLYGVRNVMELQWVKNKMKDSMQNKYGVSNVSQSEDIKKKKKETYLRRYGVDWGISSKEVRRKIAKTIQDKYNVDNVMQNNEIAKKQKKSLRQHYNVDYPMQSPILKNKILTTMSNNQNVPTSIEQKYIYSLFPNAILNQPYKDYVLDIYFPEYKLNIEYNGGGHDLRVKLGTLTQEEFKRKEIIRSSYLQQDGINQLTIISRKDYLPSDDILLKMLQETLSYLSSTNHHWQEYDIDNQTLRNATGIYPYDFGDLRKIKKSDLNNKLNPNQEITKEAS
jgi:hypothetical protein